MVVSCCKERTRDMGETRGLKLKLNKKIQGV